MNDLAGGTLIEGGAWGATACGVGYADMVMFLSSSTDPGSFSVNGAATGRRAEGPESCDEATISLPRAASSHRSRVGGMSEVVITVRGEHETRIAPERAVAHLTVRAEGPERGAVVERMAAFSEPVRDDLASRKSAGTVTEWTSQRVSVWSERPWSPDGKRLAPVHYGSVDFTAAFTDFTVLSWWAGEVAERDGVQLGWIDWQLLPETRASVEREVAAGAVAVAVARAHAYAGAVGLSTVTPIEIADVGLLSKGESPESAPAPRMLMAKAQFAADSGGAPSIQLQPEDIVISAAVEARFTAR